MEGFDSADVFDDDFGYFYADRVSTTRTSYDVGLIERVTELGPSSRVFDLCCGEGRIGLELARRGVSVVGLDCSPGYVWRATQVARDEHLDATFMVGDMRSLPLTGAFDVVVCWYTSFGFFDDVTNRQLLGEMARVLLPGGVLLIDIDSKEHLVRSGMPTLVRERGDDVMVEQFSFDATSSRVQARRLVLRDDEVHRTSYFVRAFDPEELMGWLAMEGWSSIELSSETGEPFASGCKRMLVRAIRP